MNTIVPVDFRRRLAEREPLQTCADLLTAYAVLFRDMAAAFDECAASIRGGAGERPSDTEPPSSAA